VSNGDKLFVGTTNNDAQAPNTIAEKVDPVLGSQRE